MIKERKYLPLFTSIIGEKNVDVILKNGITKEIFSRVYHECSKCIDKTELDKLENSQKDIKKLVEKKVKELKKAGICDEVIYYYGSKCGTTFKQELQDAVIFTNKNVLFYHKKIDGVKSVFSYGIPYNDILDLEYDSKSDNLVIEMIHGNERSPVISHCKATYTFLSYINELNRTFRVSFGMFDSIHVSEEYKEPLSKLREAVGSYTFDQMAVMKYKLRIDYAFFRSEYNLDLDKCGFVFCFNAHESEIEEERVSGFVAFDIRKKHFYWSYISGFENHDLHTIELNTIRNVWTDNNVVYIHYNYNTVDEIITVEYANFIFESLAAFVPTSNSWHKAYAVNGKLAKESDDVKS